MKLLVINGKEVKGIVKTLLAFIIVIITFMFCIIIMVICLPFMLIKNFFIGFMRGIKKRKKRGKRDNGKMQKMQPKIKES